MHRECLTSRPSFLHDRCLAHVGHLTFDIELHQPVDTIREIDRALEDAPGAVALTIWRDGRTMLIVLRS